MLSTSAKPKRNRRNAGLQILNPEGQPRRAHDGIHSDQGEENADQGAEQTLAEALGRQAADRAQAEESQEEVIHGLKLQCQVRDGLCQCSHDHQAEHRAHKRVDRGIFQGLPGLSAPGHGITVECGHDRGRRTGNIDQDG